MRRLTSLLVLPFVLLALPLAGSERPPIQWNDNETPAGTLEAGTLELALEVRRGDWHPLGEDNPATTALAFAEVGKAPQAPGPLIRVPEGTDVRASVTNTLDVPLEIQGLAARHDPDLDRGRLPPGTDLPWVRIPAGETEAFHFTADARGTYLYRARLPAEVAEKQEEDDGAPLDDGLLAGALIVDAPGEGPEENEVVMVIQGADNYLTINGRPWPHTERLTYDLGDDVTYRVINDTEIAHPMHLHGFFYQVESRGDIAQDTLYGPTRQHRAVTETVEPASTLKLAWTPTRPGGWIFHCHIGYDFMPNPEVTSDPDFLEWIRKNLRADDPMDSHGQAGRGMGGMVMGLYVRPPEDWAPEEPEGEPTRIHVREDSTPGKLLPRFGYAVGDPGEPPPAGEVPFPGPPLIFHEGEPAPVRVVNETDEATTVHWHGLEVESFYDGVAGVTGYEDYRTPPIARGDSFDATLRTDRPGTYMYHTHMSDIRQQSAGLYGPLIILPEGEEWDPETDRIFIVGNGTGEIEELENAFFMNGSRDPRPAEMTVGTTYRLRLLNIALGGQVLFRLAREGYPVQWRALAKDAADLPAHQRDRTAARQKVNVGETFDFTFTPEEPGDLALEVRGSEGELLVEQPIHVVEETTE